MVLVEYDRRILVDKYFLEWLTKSSDKAKTLIFLSRIKASSMAYKKTHNVLFKNDIDSSNETKNRMIRAACCLIDCPEFLSHCASDISRNIKYAIFLTNEKPYKTAILTSKKKEEEYLNDEDFKKIKEVEILVEEEATRLISVMHADLELKKNQL